MGCRGHWPLAGFASAEPLRSRSDIAWFISLRTLTGSAVEALRLAGVELGRLDVDAPVPDVAVESDDLLDDLDGAPDDVGLAQPDDRLGGLLGRRLVVLEGRGRARSMSTVSPIGWAMSSGVDWAPSIGAVRKARHRYFRRPSRWS